MKKKIVQTPHDSAFRECLSHPEIARDFMELHLPPALRKLCDLSNLKLESSSFVEDSLRAYFSDVLYSLKTIQGDGYIQIVIEHQTTPDPHMAFRLMRYAIAAMQRHLDAGHKRLPLVIPMLFYVGQKSPYPYSLNWLNEFDTPDLAKRLYGGDFPLIDVTVIPDDEIMKHRSMAALTLLQKHIRQRDLTELLDQLAVLLLAEHNSRQLVQLLVNYMLQAGEVQDVELFIHELVRRVPKHKEVLMTIAQKLEQKGLKQGLLLGKQEGLEQGLERGLEQGRKEEALKIARTMLQNGIHHDAVMRMTGLTEAEMSQICH